MGSRGHGFKTHTWSADLNAMPRRTIWITRGAAGALAVVAMLVMLDPLDAGGALGSSRARGCAVTYVGSTPIARPEPIPAGLMASLSMLRRPQTPIDIPPSALISAAVQLRSYDPSLTRELGVNGSVRSMLIIGHPVAFRARPARCFTRYPRAFREWVRRSQVRAINDSHRPAYCIAQIRPLDHLDGQTVTAVCGPLTGITKGTNLYDFGTGLGGFVPDGVAAVQLRYATAGATSVSRVRDNLFVAHLPPRLALLDQRISRQVSRLQREEANRPAPGLTTKIDQLQTRDSRVTEPIRITWLDATGQPLRRFEVPPPSPPSRYSFILIGQEPIDRG